MVTLEAKQHWMTTLELARGYIPYEPIEALRVVRELLPEIERAAAHEHARDIEIETLACRAKLALAMYGAAAQRWQEDNARRQRAFHAHELAQAAPPVHF